VEKAEARGCGVLDAPNSCTRMRRWSPRGAGLALVICSATVRRKARKPSRPMEVPEAETLQGKALRTPVAGKAPCEKVNTSAPVHPKAMSTRARVTVGGAGPKNTALMLEPHSTEGNVLPSTSVASGVEGWGSEKTPGPVKTRLLLLMPKHNASSASALASWAGGERTRKEGQPVTLKEPVARVQYRLGSALFVIERLKFSSTMLIGRGGRRVNDAVTRNSKASVAVRGFQAGGVLRMQKKGL